MNLACHCLPSRLATAFLAVSWGLLQGADLPVEVRKDVVYGEAGGVKLLMNLALPTAGDGPYPAVIFIHGGGWSMGRRTDNNYGRLIQTLACRGYVAATVDYRLAPRFKWPAQIEDVKCAIRFLRAHARELKVDPARIGVAGDSAGGHLALLAGLMDAQDGLEGQGGWPGFSSKARAVANFYGPADFANWEVPAIIEPFIQQVWHTNSFGVIANWLGTADRRSPIVRQASPMTYISSNDPPVITFHGALDLLVPLSQSQRLHAALRRAGVREKLMVVPLGLHGWGGEARQNTDRQMIEFFDAELKGIGEGKQPASR